MATGMQTMCVDNVQQVPCSLYRTFTYGVAQGLILGPLLFTIYVNDMIQWVKYDYYLYADDLALVVMQWQKSQGN